jgi:hypothetical protein
VDGHHGSYLGLACEFEHDERGDAGAAAFRQPDPEGFADGFRFDCALAAITYQEGGLGGSRQSWEIDESILDNKSKVKYNRQDF